MGRLTKPERLTQDHRLSGFDFGRPSLNEWLQRHALRNERMGGWRTYVVRDNDDPSVVAYYALAAGSIVRNAAPGLLRRNMPDPIPAVILGRLAVDARMAGRGVGSGLLKDAVLRSILVASQIGARVLIVHALDDAAASFYRHHGFIDAVGTPNTLRLPLVIEGQV